MSISGKKKQLSCAASFCKIFHFKEDTSSSAAEAEEENCSRWYDVTSVFFFVTGNSLCNFSGKTC